MIEKLTDEKQNQLIEIKYLYGLNQESSSILKEYFCVNESNDSNLLQECLVEFVLNDKILSNYKPYWKYQKSFLKEILALLETFHYEINTEIYQQYINVINNDFETTFNYNDQKYFITLFSKQDIYQKPVIIQQFATAITNGTTGLHVWPACFQLIDFLEKNKFLLNDKVILELGAGVGLLGLSCLSINSVKHYSFTDSHNLVLKQLEENVYINYDKELINLNDRANSRISIYELNWLEFNCCNLFDTPFNRNLDLIIASDIVFDPQLTTSLVKTLSFISLNQINPKKLIILIASTIRNKETYTIFLDSLVTTTTGGSSTNLAATGAITEATIVRGSAITCAITNNWSTFFFGQLFDH